MVCEHESGYICQLLAWMSRDGNAVMQGKVVSCYVHLFAEYNMASFYKKCIFMNINEFDVNIFNEDSFLW